MIKLLHKDKARSPKIVLNLSKMILYIRFLKGLITFAVCPTH